MCSQVASLCYLMLMAVPVCAQSTPAENLTSGLEFPAVGKTRVVLLRNDRCLTGIVRQLGDQVEVEIDDNARVTKPMSDVLTIADDMEGVYRFKLGRYPRLGPGEHIRMARWAMGNGLFEYASNHFLAVNREAGQNPVVRQLGIELREQLLQDEGFRNYLGLPPQKNAQADSSAVRTASTDSKEEPLAPILPAVLTSFTDYVQPILLKRCSQSGCHGFSSSNRLKFVQLTGNSRSRISEQNCRSALQFVQVDSSNMSVLLRYAVVAHGLQKEAAITAQEKRFAEVIESWSTFARNPVMAAVQETPVNAAGKADVPSATAPAVYNGKPVGKNSNAAPTPLSPLAPGATQLKPSGPVNASGQPEPVVIPGSGKVTDREIDQLDDMVRKALGEPPRSQSADPFDPAEFNRRAASGKK